MSFVCNGCKEEVSSSKMAGLAFGQISAATLESKGIKTQPGLVKAFDSHQFTAGVLTGFGVKCPKCQKSNWN